MVKTPHVRHSRQKSEPVTLDLEAVAEAPAETAEAAAEEILDNGADAPAAEETGLPAEAAETAQMDEPAAAPDGEAVAAPANAPASAMPAKPEKPKRGVFSLTAAGLIGGALALGGNYGLQNYLGSPQQAAQPDYAGQIAAQDARLADAQSAIEALKLEFAKLRESDGAAALAGQIKDIEARLAKAETGLAAAGDPAALQALESRLGTISGTADVALQKAEAAEKSASGQGKRLDAVETAIKALADNAGQQAGNPQIARAIAAAALKSAIDRGLPFMAELETYAAVAPDAEEIAVLRGLAAAGVPTRADLAIELEEKAGAMISAARPADPDAGFLQSLIDSAKDLVQVRPIGAVEGEGADAIVARMEAALKAGDLAKAMEEFRTLPEPSRAASGNLASRIEARITADTLIDKALAAALAAREG